VEKGIEKNEFLKNNDFRYAKTFIIDMKKKVELIYD